MFDGHELSLFGARSTLRNSQSVLFCRELRVEIFRLYLLLAFDASTHSSSEALDAAWLEGRIGTSVANVCQDWGPMI